MTPFLLAKQNNDKDLMNLMDKYKTATIESSLGGCVFLGFCLPNSSDSNLHSVKNANLDSLEL